VAIADEALLREHYCDLSAKPFFPGLVEYMTSGPIIAAVISGTQVIEAFRALAGATDPIKAAPGTIRGDLARHWDRPAIENIVHGSDSPDSAEREIALWFPES
jgi:nucleoside-diphosphate kinase